MIGKKIAQYEVLELLGKGGMGEVYRARDTRLGRDVALKFLFAGTAGEELSELLMREARAASALNHPNVATIYEVGEADGRGFIAMECVEGKSLAEVIPSGGFPADQVTRYGEQVAAALAHAHERGILHCDLKPANVKIAAGGRVKVFDFGMAKVESKGEISMMTTATVPLETGEKVGGTLPYMSPEVLRGEPATPRSDIWSLGVLLYEMTAGVRPFGGNSGFELTSSILKEKPATLSGETPAALRTVIGRCLSKEAGERYQSSSEVRAALEAQSSGMVEVAAGDAAKSGGRNWMWLAAAVVVLGGALGIWVWKQEPAPVGKGPTSAERGAALWDYKSSEIPEANEYMSRTQYFLGPQLDLPKAQQSVRRALELDPKFGDARAIYALTKIILVHDGWSNDRKLVYEAEEDLRRALADTPESKNVRGIMAAVHVYQGRMQVAMEESQAVVRENPLGPAGRVWLAFIHQVQGDYEGARRESETLLERNPMLHVARGILAQTEREQGKYEDARRNAEKIVDQNPGNHKGIQELFRVHLDTGKLEEARAALGLFREADPELKNFRARWCEALLLAREGKRAEAKKAVDEEMLRFADVSVFVTADAAEFYALMGEKKEALDWLDRAARGGDERVEWFRRDPLLEGIRGEARFEQILESIEFKQEQRRAGVKKGE